MRAATWNLRTVNALIAESERTIARGFAYRSEQRQVGGGISYCIGDFGMIGLCGGGKATTVEVPVAVDLEEEQRKLDSLKAKQKQLLAEARPAVAACDVTIIGP